MNCSSFEEPSLAFTYSTLSIVVCYSLVFAVAFIGNMVMFLILFKYQGKRRRRVHSLLFHMTIAHLIVTLVYMPKEIIHQVTVAWLGGDLLCRICKFFDVFGVALSAGILVCLSLDRFYSILFPLYVITSKRSVNRMLAAAWLVAFFSSLPQLYIFRNETHPCFAWYQQCVSGDVVGAIDPLLTFWFSVVNILQVYVVPLLVIIVCYGSIFASISMKSEERKLARNVQSESSTLKAEEITGGGLRCSGGDSYEKAKTRTLKMTIVLVLSFLSCWTPYTVAMFIHFLHFPSAARPIPPLLSKFLYAFAVLNSAISPYVYGFFSFNVRQELRLLYYTSWPFFSGSISETRKRLAMDSTRGPATTLQSRSKSSREVSISGPRTQQQAIYGPGRLRTSIRPSNCDNVQGQAPTEQRLLNIPAMEDGNIPIHQRPPTPPSYSVIKEQGLNKAMAPIADSKMKTEQFGEVGADSEDIASSPLIHCSLVTI